MYNTGKCVTKEIPTVYMDNWIMQMVIPDFIEAKNISSKARLINAQISEEKRKIKKRYNKNTESTIKHKSTIRITSK